MPGGLAAGCSLELEHVSPRRDEPAASSMDIGLSFIEDPFAASDIRLTHELRRDLVTPIAAGEGIFWAARSLRSGPVASTSLRVDATTIGGITGAVEAINIAAAAGRTAFPHVFSPIHIHLACAFPNVESVELITEESGADPLHLLLRNVPTAKDGKMSPSHEPGVGISVDWDAVEKLSRRHAVVEPDA